METPDSVLEEIAEQIKNGCTSGIVDDNDDKNIIFTAWELKLNTWVDD